MPKKLKKLNQTHGKKEEFVPTTLDQLWGNTGVSKYQTLDETEYTNKLGSFNKSDLQAHAIEMGLVPVDDRDKLTLRLVKEFRKHINNYKVPKTSSSSNVKIPDDIRKILNEGR